MQSNKEQGKFIEHIAHEPCGSSDGLAIYEAEDGSHNGYCWACNTYESNPYGDNNVVNFEEKKNLGDIKDIENHPIKALSDRGIRQEIAEAFGVRCGVDTGNGEVNKHFYPYYKGGEITGYKVRKLPKEFSAAGDIRDTELFGQHLCGSGGKLLIITEGECDAMAVNQMLADKGKRYRVVSLPTGANTKAIKTNLEWLEKFETIILCFDQDKVGKEAASAVVDILSIGKVKIASFSEKDPNDMLLADKTNEFFSSIMNATLVRPDGIVSGEDTWERLQNREYVESVAYPDGWEEMNKKVYGVRKCDLDVWTSGTGMGKTQVFRELQYHLLNNTIDNIGVMSLEEPLEDTVESLMALHLKKRILLPDVREGVTEGEMKDAWEHTSGTNRLHFYDHFGSVDDQSLIAKIRYLARGLDCGYVFLDHLSIAISEYADQGDERKKIDVLMSKLKRLTQELGIWIGIIVHLRKTGQGQPFEEGGVPNLDDLRGSGSLKQLSNNVYAVSRNQQADSERVRNTSRLHVLKCRLTGRTGDADYLYFEDDTGRMVPSEGADELEDEGEF